MRSVIGHSLWGIVKAVASVLFCVFLVGCEDQGASPTIDEGTYLGRFSLRLADGTEQSAGITFTFRNGRYSYTPGKSDLPPVGHSYLPPSGAGRYAIYGTTVVLTDTAYREALLDMSNILGGPFHFSAFAKTLVLSQDQIDTHWHRTIVLAYR